MQSGRIIGRRNHWRRAKSLAVSSCLIICFLYVVKSVIFTKNSIHTDNLEDIFTTDTYLHAMSFLNNLENKIESPPVESNNNDQTKEGQSIKKIRIVDLSHPVSDQARPSQNHSERVKHVSPLYHNAYIQSKLEDVIRRYGRRKDNAKLLSQKIMKESFEQNYDPLFVAAVIKSESAFDNFAKSHVGATGLMQIMPATGKYVEKFRDFEPLIGLSLTDPDYNLKLGIRYLRYLEEMFKNNRVLVLIAYNWGPGRVLDAFKGKRRVPPEVIRYATKILQDHARWRREVGFS